jgi:heme/copper-type cytochrome/quinol oxidase subunit 3
MNASSKTMGDRRNLSSQTPAQTKNAGLIGISFFIVTETMFFLGLFFSWYYLRATNEAWPPVSVARPPLLPAVVNTILSIASAVAIFLAARGIAKDNSRALMIWTGIAAALGLAFLAIQTVEFADLTRFAQNSAYGSTFIFLLFFHAARVFIGVGLMVIVFIRALLDQFSSRRRLLVQATERYWYFIVAVWLVVFTVLYLTT